MILIISFPEDPHAQAVIDHLQQMKAPYHLMDLARFPQKARLTCRHDETGSHHYYSEEGHDPLNLDDIRAVWWRRPQPFELHDDLGESGHFAENECKEAIEGLWSVIERHAVWINSPLFDEAAHKKTYQLALARDLGMRLPATCITNSPKQARRFVEERDQLIYKPFAGTVQEWRETRLLKEADKTQLDQVRHAPVILQDYIDGPDYRVTVIGQHIFPARIDASKGDYPVDFRLNSKNVSITPEQLPEKLEQQIHALMERLNLVYGAIDFRQDKQTGAFYFLEINPAGQWLFVEDQTRQPIAQTLAEELVRLAVC
jgi:glutathione synthase/RimK-type ligase-like ATP-grasp enzyme